MQHLNGRELEDARVYISNICHISPYDIIINQFGHFEIHQISERDKLRIENSLRFDDNISDISVFSSGYDFKRMSYPGLPSQKYTITGLVHMPDEVDDDVSGIGY